MEKQPLCPNTTSSEAKYSAPVPFIGLYIAAASLVCFLLILSDVIQGFRLRKRWFPCRFFSLDSVSLTLLAVAAKIPVDLTTEMPTAQDQLSKLTGVALVCVCMGFMLPSLGGKKDNECFTNMVALSIFVVTIMVNICIQMSTGLISSFFPEHIIMMYCMSMMILCLWCSTICVSPYKRYHMTKRTDLLTKGKGTMFRQLQLCDLHSNGENPQFALCATGISPIASYVCLTSLVIVLQASFRARIISQEFWDNKGCSDYGWSMRIIIGAQILAILLATITAAFRFLVVPDLLVNMAPDDEFDLITTLWRNHPYLKAGVVDYVRLIVISIGFLVLAIHHFVLCYCVLAVIVFLVLRIPCFVCNCVFSSRYCVCNCVRITGMHRISTWCVHFVGEHKNLMKEQTNLQEIKEYNDLLDESDLWPLEERTMGKCLNDMKRWMALSEKYNDLLNESNVGWLEERTMAKCLNDMKRRMALSEKSNIVSRVGEILSRTPPRRRYCDFEGYELSCFTLVFLARVASALTPSTLNAHLTQCLSEVFDLICFVHKKMHFSGTYAKWQLMLAKAMWLGKDFTTIISTERQASDIITELEKVLHFNGVRKQISFINRFARNNSTTGQELYDGIHQLFVDILHIFLSQLPCAIYKHVSECHVDEYQDSVRLALKFLCQVKCLDGQIEWSYPDGCNFTGIITSPLPAESNIITSQPTAERNIITSQMSGECAHLAAIEDEAQLACNIGCDEIIQVE